MENWTEISRFTKNGAEHIEYQHPENKMVRLTIDGEEITEFTRKSQCHHSSTYAEVSEGVEHIKCENCNQDCLTYLDKTYGN